MMSSTHAAAGLVLATVMVFIAPELAVVAAVAALAGGIFPDLDLVFVHRRTLHFPVYYTLAALPVIGLAILAPSVWTVGAAFFLASAALHCASDVLGGSVEARPWEATSEKAVYLHARKRWLAPKRLIPYDGSPQDLVVAGILSIPGLLVFDGEIRLVVVGMLAVSAGYVAIRKKLPDLEEEYLQ